MIQTLPVTGSALSLPILAAAGVLLLALIATKLSHRIGMPVLLLFVGIGLLVGESGLGVRFDDTALTQTLGTVLLAVILWEGGFSTRLDTVRSVAPRSLLLATLGVLVSVAVTSSLVYLLLDVDLRTAVVLGAVASSTDAAATFAVLRKLPIVRRVRMTLEAESGFNDPPVIVLIAVVISDAWFRMSPGLMLGTALYQLAVGLVIGLVVAWGGSSLLRLAALPASGLYPLATVAIGAVAFAGADQVGASGLLACYVAGLVLGNAQLPHRAASQGFAEALAWLAQMGLFMMLGLLASPGRLGDALVWALIVGASLTFVARPLSVVISLLPFRVPWREQLFVSWSGLRGAVPIVLAAMAMTAGIPNATRIFDVVFLLVIVFTLLQGPTLPLVARLTGVARQGATTELTFESAPLESVGTVTLQCRVPEGSRLHGVTVGELRLPDRVSVPMIIRSGEVLVPADGTRLREGDDLVLTAPRDEATLVEPRLQAVSRHGRLARWVETPDERPELPAREIERTDPHDQEMERANAINARTRSGGSAVADQITSIPTGSTAGSISSMTSGYPS